MTRFVSVPIRRVPLTPVAARGSPTGRAVWTARLKINIWYFVAALIAFSLLQGFYQASKRSTTIPYSQFETLLDQDKVDKLWIEQNTIQGTLKKPEKDGLKQFVTTRVTPDLATC